MSLLVKFSPGHYVFLFHAQSDYLEALTTAYIRSGVLMVPEHKDYSLRYSNGMGKNQDSGLAVQYLATQLADLTAESGSENDSGPLMRNAACQWSPQPEIYANYDSDAKNCDEETREAVLGLIAVVCVCV